MRQDLSDMRHTRVMRLKLVRCEQGTGSTVVGDTVDLWYCGKWKEAVKARTTVLRQ